MEKQNLFSRTDALVKEGIESGAYPCAAYAIGIGDRVLADGVAGNRQIYPEKEPITRNTLFDLASLSKLVATTMVALRMLEEGKILLTDPLSRYLPDTGVRADVTVFQLMTHTSGITPHIPLAARASSPEDSVRAILASDPFCKPGEQVYYSCMGYILLGKILEKVGGEPLDRLAERYVFRPLDMLHTCYNPDTPDVAATEYSAARNCYIKGRVHDENAFFLGGVSANAGVFSDLADMEKFAAMISGRGRTGKGLYLNSRTFEKAITDYTSGMNEHRGLGFQLTAPITTLTGDLFAPGSYGHTGFTGTSLYCDRETGLWGVLLTNAVHFGRENKGSYFRYRRLFYQVMTDEYFRAADAGDL